MLCSRLVIESTGRLVDFFDGDQVGHRADHPAELGAVLLDDDVPDAVQPEAVAARRGLPVEDVAPAALLRARAEQPAAAPAEVSS